MESFGITLAVGRWVKIKIVWVECYFMKTFALLKGVEIVFHQGLFPIIIETDSTEVITLFMKNEDLLFNSLISQCRYWLRKLQNPVIQHTFRKGNMAQPMFWQIKLELVILMKFV